MAKKILITGGSGRFGQIFKKYNSKFKILFPSKKDLNILKFKNILSYIVKAKPNYLIHLAGLSRPMDIHDKEIVRSIDLNIIGTANITKACAINNVKLIYFSTHYVYEGKKGNYKESDPILPVNNYAWSKLGGEASVQLYKNSLILRVCMTEKPFVHKSAFKDVMTNFLFHEEVVPIVYKLLDCKGVVNIGGKKQSIFDFAYKNNKTVNKIYIKKTNLKSIPINSTLNLNKLKLLIKK